MAAERAAHDSGRGAAAQMEESRKGLHLGGSDGEALCSRDGKTFPLVTPRDCGEHNGRGRLLYLMWHYGMRR